MPIVQIKIPVTYAGNIGIYLQAICRDQWLHMYFTVNINNKFCK